MCKMKCKCSVRESAELAPGVFSLWLSAQEIVDHAVPGQFVSLYCGEKDRLLPRPISICELDAGNGLLRLVFRVVGAGTKEFSELSEGDTVEVMGPLGNGYVKEDGGKSLLIGGGKSLLIGGGIGVPPMLELAKQASVSGHVTVVLGYRDSHTFLKDEFEKYGTVFVATEDGSIGTKGTVLDAIDRHHVCGGPGEKQPFDTICACGPAPMLRGVKAFGLERGIVTYLSLEERMACGIGACLGCVCQTTSIDAHSKVKNARVCKDGPVFLSTDVEL